jgi:hypothetical protein
MRFGAALALLLVTLTPACGGAGFFRQYEYEEETYLSLDGSATVYVNSSVPALNALRGSRFDPKPGAAIDKAAVAAFFDSDGVQVTRVNFSHRNDRLYLHVRMSVDDVRGLQSTKPFNWSTYAFAPDGSLMLYRQHVGSPKKGAGGIARWNGDELVAFRIHVPSKVPYHNAGADNLKRGNILVWEQPLADRLAGVPVDIDARIETQSILYRTLALFGITILAVAATFGAVLWWIVKRSRSADVGHVRQVEQVGR